MPALYADHHVLDVRRNLQDLPRVKDAYASDPFHLVEVTYDEKGINDVKIVLVMDNAGHLRGWVVPDEACSETDRQREQPQLSGRRP